MNFSGVQNVLFGHAAIESIYLLQWYYLFYETIFILFFFNNWKNYRRNNIIFRRRFEIVTKKKSLAADDIPRSIPFFRDDIPVIREEYHPLWKKILT
jgi:hypothetical protein